MRSRFVSLCLLFALLLSGCTLLKKTEPPPEKTQEETAPAPTEEPKEPEPEVPQGPLNPLTGLEAGMTEKALSYNQEALAYDDEDPICLDNMGQTYYRLVGDKAKAKEYFDAAHKIKPGQIDTLWFLSRYDLEAGDTAAALEKLRTALEGRFSPMNYASKEMVEKEIQRLEQA